jgi:hypothetical protein
MMGKGLKLKRLAAVAAVAAISLGGVATAQENLAAPRIQTQPGDEQGKPGITGQDGDEKSLEIAPQPGTTPLQPGISEIPSERKFTPSEESARLSPKFVPGQTGEGGRACLGISMRFATRCLLGAEEHGLEVVEVDPSSPAAQAGFKTRGGGGLASIAAGAGALLGPLNLALMAAGVHDRAEHNESGDLIVAVDDVRVRSEGELKNELDKLKPGDLAYVTVLRPLPGGQHQTVKVAIKLGMVRTDGNCAKAEPAVEAAAPPVPRRPGAETYAD